MTPTSSCPNSKFHPFDITSSVACPLTSNILTTAVVSMIMPSLPSIACVNSKPVILANKLNYYPASGCQIHHLVSRNHPSSPESKLISRNDRLLLHFQPKGEMPFGNILIWLDTIWSLFDLEVTQRSWLAF